LAQALFEQAVLPSSCGVGMGAHLASEPESQWPAFVPVTLHVYDALTRPDFIACNRALLHLLGTGAFHCGVQVYGREWSYRKTRALGTGVFCHKPKSPPGASPCESISMGTVELSANRFQLIIENLAMEWVGSEYDLLAHNCCHFCKELCKRLGVVIPFPTWISQLAETGQTLRKEGCEAAKAIANCDRTAEDAYTAACSGGKSCMYGCFAARQGDERTVAHVVQGPAEDEVTISPPQRHPPRWSPACMLCEGENGLVGLEPQVTTWAVMAPM